MKTNIYLYCLLIFIVIPNLGCNQSSSGSPGSGGGTVQPASCESAWVQFVAANPIGHLEETQINTTTELVGAPSITTSQKQTKEILESNDTQVKIKLTIVLASNPSQPIVSEAITTKSQFLSACQLGSDIDNPSVSVYEVIEQRSEMITVRAGTFNCNYIKAKIKMDSPQGSLDGTQELWSNQMAPVGMTVKSILKLNLLGGATQTTTTELIRHLHGVL